MRRYRGWIGATVSVVAVALLCLPVASAGIPTNLTPCASIWSIGPSPFGCNDTTKVGGLILLFPLFAVNHTSAQVLCPSIVAGDEMGDPFFLLDSYGPAATNGSVPNGGFHNLGIDACLFAANTGANVTDIAWVRNPGPQAYLQSIMGVSIAGMNCSQAVIGNLTNGTSQAVYWNATLPVRSQALMASFTVLNGPSSFPYVYAPTNGTVTLQQNSVTSFTARYAFISARATSVKVAAQYSASGMALDIGYNSTPNPAQCVPTPVASGQPSGPTALAPLAGIAVLGIVGTAVVVTIGTAMSARTGQGRRFVGRRRR